MINHDQIPGYGVDSDPSKRPGVPMYQSPPRALPFAEYPPPRQQTEVKQFMHGRPHKDYPPVWGTAQPPKGIAGAMRKLAYSWPDHQPKHWVLLLAADRVDVLEHRVRRRLPVFAAMAGGFLLGRALVRRFG